MWGGPGLRVWLSRVLASPGEGSLPQLGGAAAVAGSGNVGAQVNLQAGFSLSLLCLVDKAGDPV